MAVIDTPCQNVCVYNAGAGVCLGCGRTLDEIARWTALAVAERARIMAELPQRLATLGSPPPAA